MESPPSIPHLFRREYGKIVAVLARRFGFEHLEVAEDLASETFLAAMEQWPYRGVPPNPAAWLHTVAANKARNYLQRDAGLPGEDRTGAVPVVRDRAAGHRPLRPERDRQPAANAVRHLSTVDPGAGPDRTRPTYSLRLRHRRDRGCVSDQQGNRQQAPAPGKAKTTYRRSTARSTRRRPVGPAAGNGTPHPLSPVQRGLLQRAERRHLAQGPVPGSRPPHLLAPAQPLHGYPCDERPAVADVLPLLPPGGEAHGYRRSGAVPRPGHPPDGIPGSSRRGSITCNGRPAGPLSRSTTWRPVLPTGIRSGKIRRRSGRASCRCTKRCSVSILRRSRNSTGCTPWRG